MLIPRWVIGELEGIHEPTLRFRLNTPNQGDRLVLLLEAFARGETVFSDHVEYVRGRGRRLHVSLGRRAGYSYASRQLSQEGFRVAYVAPTPIYAIPTYMGSETQNLTFSSVLHRSWDERLRGRHYDVIILETLESHAERAYNKVRDWGVPVVNFISDGTCEGTQEVKVSLGKANAKMLLRAVQAHREGLGLSPYPELG